MKHRIPGGIRSVFAVALVLVMAFCLASCNFRLNRGKDKDGSTGGETEGDTPGTLEKTDPFYDFLHVEGESVVTDDGREVMLRGVNAGGLFVIEQWMNGFRESGPANGIDIVARDHRTTTEVFLERFGEEKTKELWDAYRENWWSEADFENCAAMGMNVIRLPFTYMTVDFAAVESYDLAGEQFDFTALDAFVDAAAAHGMYTILDLHGAYGSQNGQDHSGETIDDVSDVDYYSNERMIGLTAKLWRAVAEHYKDDPAVAGYDILNEPGEKALSTEERHFKVFDVLYDAIREVDPDHIVIFESCWEGENLPQPSEYGWENCMYSFHHYTNMANGGQYTQHGVSFNDKIANVSRQHFGVPLFMGEFNCYNDEEQWEYTLGLLNRLGWHWTSWTYKINNTWGNSAWGIVSVPAEDKVNAHTDGYDMILRKFSALKTDAGIRRTMLQTRTLESIMKEFCTEQVLGPISEGSYLFADSITDRLLTMKGNVPVLGESGGLGTMFTVRLHEDGDGSILLSPGAGGGTLAVVGGVLALGGEGNSTRFYAVGTEYGYALISYVTCRYLRFGEDGRLYADGTVLEDSAIFYLR